VDQTRTVDLVLEGGGVKGIALVGAATALSEHGYTFARIGGSSAGAMVGSIMAAMQQAGEPFSRVDDIMRTIDYLSFMDRRRGARFLTWWPRGADAWGVLFHLGAYRGLQLDRWLRGVLADLGVRTFGDLAFDDPGSALPPGDSYRLVVTASDVSRKRAMFLPWDLRAHGRDPDEYPVARAVRASAAIPFFFEPVRVDSQFGKLTLVDGSLLRTYPIDIFDRKDGKPSRWPTIGVRLSSPAGQRTKAQPVTTPIALLENLIKTTVDSTQVRHVSEPAMIDRSIFAKPKGVRFTDFDLTSEQRTSLFEAGHAAATAWVLRHPDGPPASTPGEDQGFTIHQ